ncbi:hypothetical protein [uncultured Chitinophaga sp.]|uniref:hypothetical protein n=1 Tax=uncultured Chitinophaga sp. TaxID=339340 RepID=UPI0025D8C602|nr:hypothetical protein [uncultured Chitinophaga sp.]
MRRFTFQKTLPGKCLAFGVYFLFFFVQLHLRYVFVFTQDAKAEIKTVRFAGTHYKFSKYNRDTQDKSGAEVKHTKRYIPAHVFEPFSLEIQFHLSTMAVLLKKEVVATPSFLLPTLLSSSSFRGPPSFC